jgi:outer membrane lipoprotein SlyB
MLRKHASAIAACGLAAAIPAAVLAQVQIGQPIVPSQTVITGTLEHPINTKTAAPTDQFVLDIQPPYPGDDQRLNGARVIGHVASVDHAAGNKKGTVTLAFDRLVMADGTEASVTGQMISTQGQQGGNTAGRAIVGGIIGQIVGNYIGKHIGTDVGGAVGIIGGAAYGASLGTNVTLPQGSTVAFRTTQPAVVTGHRQAGDYPSSGQAQPSYSQPINPLAPSEKAPPSYSQPPPAPQPSPTI